MYNASFPVLSFSLVGYMQPKSAGPKEGDYVMATSNRVPGNGFSI